jgi:hypothetical protein
VPDWLAFIVLGVAWTPVLVFLHEAAHAFAALALTDGDVSISMRGAGAWGGSVNYEPASLRRARGEAWIAAAGPAVTLIAATAPPGGIERELRRLGEPERGTRPIFVVLLVLVAVLAVAMDPVLGLALVGLSARPP